MLDSVSLGKVLSFQKVLIRIPLATAIANDFGSGREKWLESFFPIADFSDSLVQILFSLSQANF